VGIQHGKEETLNKRGFLHSPFIYCQLLPAMVARLKPFPYNIVVYDIGYRGFDTINKIMTQGRKLTLVIALVALLSVALIRFPAGAVPLEERRTQAQREVEEAQQRLEDAVERYKYACYRLERTRAELEETRAELAKAEAELKKKQERLNSRIRAMYVTRHNQFLDVVVNAGSFDEFLIGLDLTKKIGRNDAELVRKVKDARARLKAAEEGLKARETEQAAVKRNLAESKAAVERQLRAAKGKLAGVEEEIRQMLARRTAESVSRSGNYSRVPTISPVWRRTRPPGAPHSGVVGVAYAQLGKPYVWGAAGPNAFDCSGLTQYCYRVGAGIYIPHSSYAQAYCGTPVSVSELQPGDILGFRGWGHVGIYIGGGQYIHAPHTGAVVRIDSLASRRNFCGAVRP